jgi:hypothetical protein
MTPATIDATIPQGKFGKIKTGDDDIGGQLLPILSKGLYTNPLDCIREYVQNGVDAGAQKVTIKITGNSVTIHDNGHGMDEAQLRSSRKFGISAKDLSEQVGFRGIGIYSGYDLANRLIITTKKASSPLQLVMRFDFAAMKKELEKQPPGSVSLSALLYNFTTFKSEEASVANSSFTTVQLEQINEVHLRKIANRNELRKYILQNLPVDFSELFDYRTQIIEKLSTNVPGFKAVVIELQSDEESDEIVSKPPLRGLRTPEFGRIEGEDGKPVAYYWACLNQENKRLGPENLILEKTDSCDPSQYQGFVYKCKGFTIGNRDQLNKVFKAGSGTLYGWYTGEIYVTDQLVIPNTARDDFETNAAKTRLEIAVNKKLETLEDYADKVRQQAQADTKIHDALRDLTALTNEINKNGIASLDDFSKLRDIRAVLKKYKRKASPLEKESADQASKVAERMDKEIRTSVGKSAVNSGGVSRRAKFAPTLPFPTAETPAASTPQTLSMMIDQLDLLDSPNSRRLIESIDSALIAILGTEAVVYKRVVESVESILQGEE